MGNKVWLKVETTIDELLEQNDIKQILGYEDGFVYVELNIKEDEKINK